MFLDGILKGLVLWLYGLILEGVEYMADSLLEIFSLDLAYFETYAPVVREIQNIVIAVGWALLIGNLVFQAMRSMAAGLGFEGEDPVALGTRTFVFAFLLLASRQICAIGLNFTSAIMDLFQVPDAVEIITPDENAFGIDSSWLLAMIVGLILIFQVIKFFFEIGERYVVTMILVVLAPLAFGMGGSMCVMMLMNVIFLKLLLSTMSTVPSGLGIFPWLIFVTAIVRVGRKIDDIVCRMGLNPAHTGSPLGHGFMALPTMMANHAARTVVQTVTANRTGGGKTPSSGNRNTNRPSGGSAAPGPNPSSPPPPAGGGTSGSALRAVHRQPGQHPKPPIRGLRLLRQQRIWEQPRASRERLLRLKEQRRRVQHPQGHPLGGAGNLRRLLPVERLDRQAKRAACLRHKLQRPPAHPVSRGRPAIPPHSLRRQPLNKTLG